MDREQDESRLQDVIADERGRYRRGGAPVDSAARAWQRQRERDQADDERALLRAIKKRDKKKVTDALRKLGASAELVEHVERLWRKLPPK